MPSPIDVQKALAGASYPAERDDLVTTAEDNEASEDVLGALRGLDESQTFDGPDDVMEALGGGALDG
jgi:hypothetical protein